MRSSGFTVLLAALTLSAWVAGCGDEEEGAEVTSGGRIVASYTAQPDALDPALSYTQGGWEAMWLVYTPLLTYAHASGPAGAELIPGLAEELPGISQDGLTYTLTLRDGLTYSDGSPVVASDFEHSIKRVLNLESGGSGFYLGIEGAAEYVEKGRPEGDISGIETDDETGSIEITLTAPDAGFQHALAMNFAGLVPAATPFANQTKEPPPGVGAYAIASSEPNREFVLERREDFAELGLVEAGIPAGNLDEIRVLIQPELETQAQDVSSGELDFMLDPPPADALARIREEEADRYREFEAGATTYLFLNSAVPPFDDPDVREAAALAIDKAGIARVYGGLMEPSCNFLPSSVPGHEEIAGEECPQGDPEAPPDRAAAEELIRDAGAEGSQVSVFGPNEGPDAKAATAIADALTEIGLEAEPELIDFALFFQTITTQANETQAGVVSFVQDFPHPVNYLGSFSGEVIAPEGNLNFANADDPGLTERIESLRGEADLDTAAPGWAEVDRAVIEADYAVPLGHPKKTTYFSERMNFEECSGEHPVYIHDWSRFCLD